MAKWTALGRRTRRLSRALKDKPLLTFKPSKAFSAFMVDESPRILLRAANRVGKSKHCAVKLVDNMLKRPGLRCRGVAGSYRQATKVLGRYLSDLIPRSALSAGCSYSPTTGWSHSLIRLKNGSTCQIMTSDQQPIQHEGDSLDIVWCDEIPKQAILDANLARVMDREGAVWISATMINRPSEWLKKIVTARDSLWGEYVVAFSRETCPWYSQAQVDQWIKEAKGAPWAYRQRILAEWDGAVMDRRLSGYTERSILKAPVVGRFTLGVGIDHGETAGNQVAVLVGWSEALGLLQVIDEYVSDGPTTINQDANGIRQMLERNGARPRDVSVWKGDSNSAGKGRVGFTINQLLGNALGVVIEPPNKTAGSVETGEWLLNTAMMEGKVKIVAEKCPQLDKSVRYYNGGEKFKHFIDGLRYVAAPVLASWGVLPTASKLYWR